MTSREILCNNEIQQQMDYSNNPKIFNSAGSIQKKITLIALLGANLLIILGLVYIRSNERTSTKSKASENVIIEEPDSRVTPQAEAQRMTKEEKITYLRSRGIEVAVTPPLTHKIYISDEGLSTRPLETNTKTPIIWQVESGVHQLVFLPDKVHPEIATNTQMSKAFTEAGEYDYYDAKNENIRGRIIVREP